MSDLKTKKGKASRGELLRRARAGDRRAREELFADLRPELRRRAAKHLGQRRPLGMQESDLANEACLRLDRRLNELRSDSEEVLRDYTDLIFESIISDWYAAAHAQRRDESLTVSLSPDDMQGVAANQVGLSEQTRDKERWQSLWAVLSRLTARQRQALLMRLDGASLREIAGAVGQENPTVAANLLARAVKAVQRELAMTWAGGDDDDPKEARVLQAFRHYLDAAERGEVKDREAFLAQHPAIAAPLRGLMDGLDRTLAQVRAAVAAEDGAADEDA